MTSPSLSTSLTFKNNELIINYHDAVIYGWELKLIERRTEWLNDSCIHFFFTHLQQHRPSCKTRRRSFLFMDPSVVSFWMHQCIDEDEIDEFVNNTRFPGKGNERDGVIFIAVNDKMSTYSSSDNDALQISGGGNHWSLLVLEVTVSNGSKKDNNEAPLRKLRFWHFDSICNSGNIQAAEDIAAKLYLHVYPEALIITKAPSLASDSYKTSQGMVHQAETPQQENGYDCGVHVLGAAKILSRYMSMTKVPSDKDFIRTSDSHSRRPLDLEECLQAEIGNSSHVFCSKLKQEISSEIRRLHNKMNK